MDITIVCGRRPDLLERTLASFGAGIIANFAPGTVYANIDPFCGTEAEGDQCEALLRNHFKSVEISRPETPSFGAAVRRLWQKPTSDYFLHMEDDWEVLVPVTPDQIEPRLRGPVVQVQLASLDRLYLPRTYSYKTTWRNILGLKFLKRVHQDRPLFATSPSFIKTSFARTCAGMMDPAKDPEKQLFAEGTALGDYTRAFRNHPLQAPGRKAVVRDLGRAWLAEHGTRKRLVDGVSFWEPIA
ncbi:hypothetical protein GC209_15630 [bacterium]|nr:hypothetical protein [bacterium]